MKRDYRDILNEAWQQHLAPRASDAPTVISTFAGGGGSSLGYSMAGYRELLAAEWDDNAVETFKLNFPNVPVYHGDIGELTVAEVLEKTGLQPGKLDVFDGSPPCQGFSTAGRRILDDERNQLFQEFVRLLRGLQPKTFVMENVSGMVKGKMKLVFVEILRELKASGYRVSARLLNAMYFNVPQRRQRLIFIGVRDDLAVEPSHPKAQNIPIKFYQACGDLKDLVFEDDRPLPELVVQMAKIQPAGQWTTDLQRYRAIKGNEASARSLNWASWNRVCGTLVKSEIAVAGAVHPDRRRYLSLAEAKRIGSFPDAFQFVGGRGKGIERIGNSVPPLLMRAIAAHIKDEILQTQEIPAD